MKRSILALLIVVAMITVAVVPAAATLPKNNPLPKTKDWTTVWTLLTDLQTQITNLQTQITNLQLQIMNIPLLPGPTGPTGPTGPSGADGATVHFGERQIFSIDTTTPPYISDPVATDGFVSTICISSGVEMAYIDGHIVGGSMEAVDVVPVDALYASIIMPVRKGEAYRLDWNKCQKIVVHWLPLSA